MTTRLRRSCLAVPGSSAKMLAKAAQLPADEVFLDLEDAVAPELKNDETRRAVAEALRGEWRAPTRAVRVNGVETPWWEDDLRAAVAGGADCVIVPKVERVEQVEAVDGVLAGLGSDAGLELQVESPRGLVEVERLAIASARVETLILGPGDYAAAAGMPELSIGAGEGERWHYVLARIVTAARAFGLQAIDGPYAAIRDLDGLRESALRSRALGYDGKWVVHPDQIAVCNEVYAPTAAELERAQQILAAYDEAADGAVLLDGEMIDEASRKMAVAIAERGRAAGAL
ncbi:MAG: CoA ester lyase [Actinobacteria bacterium]|nr:CoA ester lyase [Actinomycetota bacterium]MBV8395557.1 CoA ester lyase [Actinomycetota bacterium]